MAVLLVLETTIGMSSGSLRVVNDALVMAVFAIPVVVRVFEVGESATFIPIGPSLG